MIGVKLGRSDLPFANDPSGRFLPGVTAFMVFLAIIAGAAAIVASALAGQWAQGAEGRMTVHIAAQPNESVAALDARAQQALRLAGAAPGVETARRLPREEVAALLAPWLGAAPTQDLPLPELIDIVLTDGGDDAALTRVQAALAGLGPGVEVEDHGDWLDDLVALATTVQATAFAVLAIVGAAAALVVAFAVRAGFAIHRDSIEVLHMIGAQDRYISDQFEGRTTGLAARGALLGLGVGAVALGAVAGVAWTAEPGLLPALEGLWTRFPLLLLAPVAAILIAKFTARAAVLRDLARLV